MGSSAKAPQVSICILKCKTFQIRITTTATIIITIIGSLMTVHFSVYPYNICGEVSAHLYDEEQSL